MNHCYYETIPQTQNSGIHVDYVTRPGGYHPMHWHEELEILYPLNGFSEITAEKEHYRLPKKHFSVIESCVVHSTFTTDDITMYLCIQIAKKHFTNYLHDIEQYRIHCTPDSITDEQFPDYRKICALIEELLHLYVKEPPTFYMESEGIVLQILSKLICCFSEKEESGNANKTEKLPAKNREMERIRTVITYVEENFQNPISLDEISGLLGYGKEYFCRFFKRNIGTSFLNYVNEVRLSHVYQDLTTTDLSIQEIMEKNGFSSQKLFNQNFKRLYGCTPSQARKTKRIVPPDLSYSIW